MQLKLQGSAVVGLALIVSSACVRTKTPPDPPQQVNVTYGPKIFLADHTQSLDDPPAHCTEIGALSGTASTTLELDGVEIENHGRAVNCYVEVTSGTLPVDAVEVTNDLFQLCVDSGVCKKPNPGDVEKGAICDNEENFGACPVVSVQHFEAIRFCEFVGRRLPSSVEHVMMRQGNHPTTAADVQAFAMDDMGPTSSCSPKGILKECRRPSPVIAEDGTLGAASGDRTGDGVFDLTGNVSEWAMDLLPAERGAASNLPWFCERALDTKGIDNLGVGCPSDEVCVMGWYNPGQGLGWGLYPVCYASGKLSIENGEVGALFGGNYNKSENTALEAGTFARLKVNNPDEDPAEATRGFRCVGTSGAPETIVPKKGGVSVSDDAGVPPDSGPVPDAGTPDMGTADAGFPEAGPTDTGTVAADAGSVADTGPTDTGTVSGGDA